MKIIKDSGKFGWTVDGKDFTEKQLDIVIHPVLDQYKKKSDKFGYLEFIEEVVLNSDMFALLGSYNRYYNKGNGVGKIEVEYDEQGYIID